MVPEDRSRCRFLVEAFPRTAAGRCYALLRRQVQRLDQLAERLVLLVNVLPQSRSLANEQLLAGVLQEFARGRLVGGLFESGFELGDLRGRRALWGKHRAP